MWYNYHIMSHHKAYHSDSPEYRAAYYQKHKARLKALSKVTTAKRYREGKAFIDAYKRRLGCRECGRTEPCGLDLHHTDPSVKNRDVARLASCSKARIVGELAKCVVLCAYCHRLEHYN